MKIKKYKNAIKKIGAFTLAFALTVSGLPNLGGIEAHATELEDNSSMMSGPPVYTEGNKVNTVGNFTFGGSDSAAFIYGAATNNTNAGGVVGANTFNIGSVQGDGKSKFHGYYEADKSFDGTGSADKPEGSVQYESNWFPTYYAFGQPYEVNASSYVDTKVTYDASGIPTGATSPTINMDIYNKTAPLAKNGQVKEIVSGTHKFEVRQSLYPSDDGLYLILEYTVRNAGTARDYFMIGNESDTELAHHDSCPIVVTKQTGGNNSWEGVHFQATKGDVMSTFDIISDLKNDPYGLGMSSTRNSDDKSQTRVWAGKYSQHPGGSAPSVNHTRLVFTKSEPLFMSSGDSAAALSAYFDLEANEIKTAKFALALRDHVYYVDGTVKSDATNAGLNFGYMGGPFRSGRIASLSTGNSASSIENAIKKAKDKNHKKIYIMVQKSEEISNTIQIPSGMDVTIMTTDFSSPATLPTARPGDSNGNMVYKNGASNESPQAYAGDNVTLSRADGFKDELFKVEGKLSFASITVDGANKEAQKPLITVSDGGVLLTRTGADIKGGNTENTPEVASAIGLSTTAKLEMNNGTVEGNKSGDKAAAIVVNSTDSKAVQLQGTVTVEGNTLKDGTTKANVLLKKNGQPILVNGTLTAASKIGISLANDVVPKKNNLGFEAAGSAISTATYSASNFVSDTGANVIDATTGHNYTNDGGVEVSQRSGYIYIETQKYSISILMTDENGIPLTNLGVANPQTAKELNGPPNDPSITVLSRGFDISYNWPATITGTREFVPILSTDPDQLPTEGNWSADATGIRGKMPGQDTLIKVKFRKKEAVYHFDTQGGLAISDVRVTVGPSALGSLPTPVKGGFIFKGWKQYTELSIPPNNVYDAGVDTPITNTASLTGYFDTYPSVAAIGTTNYFAEWTPDTTQYHTQKKYTNINPNPSLSFGSETGAGYVLNGSISETSPNIPGYRYQTGSSIPSMGTFSTGPAPTGTFTHSSAPGADIELNYRYTVDPTQNFTFNVEYRSGSSSAPGPVIASAPAFTPLSRRAEQKVVISAPSIPGYTFAEALITSGANDGEGGPYTLGLNTSQGLLENEFYKTTGQLDCYMPNQNVTLTYYYTVDSGSSVTRRFLAQGNPVYARNDVFEAGGSIGTLSIPQAAPLYGYKFDSSVTDAVVMVPAGALTVNPTDGSLTGNMPSSGGVNVTYNLARDASKWNNLHFDFVNDGSSTRGTISSSGPISILTDDGVSVGHENAYTFSKIKTEAGFPSVTANRYYMVDGWYRDAAGTTKINDTDRLPTNSSGLQTVYVKIVEDPSMWVDVNFESADTRFGTLISSGVNVPGGTPQHLHFDEIWSNVTKPASSPTANYELKRWLSPAGTLVGNGDTMVTGTYKAVFGKVNAIWGLDPGAFGATGKVAPNGSGTVTVTGTTPGNKYVVVDPDGKIVGVGVADGPVDGSNVVFPNLVPGRTYKVLEGTPDTQATVGSPETSITGSSLSAPKPVTIPAIGDNKNVGVDPINPERAQIVVNPADPDADYALIDSKGNVVNYPGSDNGWMTPVGNNPSTVTFNDLDPGETYTVVARKKGNPSETPLGNIDAGVAVVANPGDMVEAQKYIIETRTNGIGTNLVMVRTVGNDTVNTPSYNQAKANSEFSIHAEPVDSQGNAFKYWTIMNGRIPGVTAKITESDYNGKIAMSNVIFRAVYDVTPRDATGDKIAPVEQGTGGLAAEGEFSLNPEQISDIENNLTNPTDKSLINVNGADVRYKVLFNKRNSKANEETAVKNSSTGANVWSRYPEAFTSAYALDVKEERYVDGRLVQNASPSNATLKVVVQLPNQDADMLDYEVWDLGSNVDNHWNKVSPTTATQVTFTEDVENNAGLLSFDGNLNHTYVLVYAKTFKLYFIDNNPSTNHLHLGDTSKNFFKKIKVRKKDTVDSSDYASDYSIVTTYADGTTPGTIDSPFDDILGVTHTYVNWSKKDMPANISVFDPSAKVTKTMSIFAYYNNNKPAVDKARVDLTNLIPVAKDLALSPYLFSDEVNELNQAIADAQNVLDRVRGRLENGIDPLRMANYPELQDAIDALQRIIDRMNQLAAEREGRVNARTGGRSGGGTGSPGSGGGGGARTPLEGTRYKNMPLSGTPQITFTLGADGNWTMNPITKRWSFTLNGGLPLNNRWARIDVSSSEGRDASEWYRFDNQASLVTGWFYDTESKNWFYLNSTDGKDLGKMVRGWYHDDTTNDWYYLNKEEGSMEQGWHHDADDGRWYYLDPTTGKMDTGWQLINGKWYFFNQLTPGTSWKQENGKWVYGGKNVRPFGSLYISERTPDGYMVNSDGEWIQ